MSEPKPFRLKEPATGTCYTKTAQVSYLKYPEGLTLEELMEELRRQPHLRPLEKALSPDRRFYLLCGAREELMQMACTYIGLYHVLQSQGIYAEVDASVLDEAEEQREDDDLDLGGTEADSLSTGGLDFSRHLPTLQTEELGQEDQDDFMPSGFFLHRDRRPPAPWWARVEDCPLCVEGRGYFSAKQIRRLWDHPLTILWIPKDSHQLSFSPQSGLKESADGGERFLADLCFELECQPIRLSEPASDSPYKCQILQQDLRERGAVPPGRTETRKILHLIEKARGDTDNATLVKAAGNAVLRRPRRRRGAYTALDFQYLLDLGFRGAQTEQKEDAQGLIGQEGVRRQLEGVLSALSFQKRRASAGLPADVPHLCFAFLGAPGTGKTTWAQWLGRRLEEEKLLADTSMISLNAAELKAKYVGHTAARVKYIFDSYGIIFLDEAYSLTEGPDGGDLFGREALSQLCVELEAHAGDRLVIFAGYGSRDGKESPMGHFLRSNPGIESRVGFKIWFDDMPPEQLSLVYASMLEQRDYRLSDGVLEMAEAFFRRRMGAKAFGNCREARNLAERTTLHMAVRLSRAEKAGREELRLVLPQDTQAAVDELLSESEQLSRDGRRTAIGF